LPAGEHKGHGLRLNLAYETSSWSASVFYRYWDIADSETGTCTSPSVVYTGYEPHNVTREVGLQLRYRFR